MDQKAVCVLPLVFWTQTSSTGGCDPFWRFVDVAMIDPSAEFASTRSKSDCAFGHSSHFRKPQATSPFGQMNVLPSSSGVKSMNLSPFVSEKFPDQWVTASFPDELTQRMPLARASATIASTGSLGSFVPRPAL